MASPVTGINTSGLGGGGTDWSWLAPFITGAGNIATSGLDMRTGREAAGMADPFSGERGRYMGDLGRYMTANPVNPGQVTAGSNNALGMVMHLLQNPGSLTTMPGYQFGLNQALEGVNRGAGASGLLNSGNRLAALQDRGEGYAQSWQNQIFNQLLGNVSANNSVAQLGLNAQGQGYNQLQHLAGADTGSPTAAAQALLGGRQAQANSIGSGIAGFANAAPGAIAAFNRLFGNGGGGWNGATPGAANGQWDVDPGNVGGGANGQWDFGGSGGWTDTIGDASGGLGGGLEWIDTLGG
jgi:hypothetical protein